MDYNPASDVTALEQLWREQQAMVNKRTSYLGRNAENIRANHSRGMSRQALNNIYGAEAVSLAIGYPAPEDK